MSNWVNDIENMHAKFGVHEWVKRKIEEKDFDSLRKFLDLSLIHI